MEEVHAASEKESIHKVDGDNLESEIENDFQQPEVNFLRQTELLTFPIMIRGSNIDAMLDSGAEMTFIRDDLARNLKLEREDEVTEIVGYGSQCFNTIGTVKEIITIDNYKFAYKLHILPTSSMKQQVIMGLDFMKQCQADMDVQMRIIKLTMNNGSQISLKLDKSTNQIATTEYNMIPVYATQDTSIENSEISFIQIASPNLDMRDSDYLFEGKDDKVEFFCGIVTGDRRNVAVRNESGARIKVEKGKQIGMISKLMEDDKQTLDDTWTMKSLKEKD